MGKIVNDLTAWKKEICDTERIVFVNGCFDLLHLGHLHLLQKARELGTVLFVAVNGDESVKKLKGLLRPVLPEQHRIQHVAALECVNFCHVFHSVRCTHVIEVVRPHVWVKSAEYNLRNLSSEEYAAARKIKAEIIFIPCLETTSTTFFLQQYITKIHNFACLTLIGDLDKTK